MIVRATPRIASLGPRFRHLALVLAALFVAHDAIYLAQFGLGAGYSRAMSQGGHDGYWLPASFVLTVAVAIVGVSVISAYLRLLHQAASAEAIVSGPSYLQELASIWLRLFPTVALLFCLQENAEHLIAEGHLAGVSPLFGVGSALVLPVLAATTFALSVIGALVRWRIAALAARIRAARPRFGRVPAVARPARWVIVAAAIANRWIIARRDAGRAPPDLRLSIATTA
jgi:hypothetical protein